jgi:hypothetical protein
LPERQPGREYYQPGEFGFRAAAVARWRALGTNEPRDVPAPEFDERSKLDNASED